jgi:mannose-6-phosphate isomerase-like protein (cupin superfamily)
MKALGSTVNVSVLTADGCFAERGFMMQKRRVVTGQRADGKAVIVGDELIDPLTVALAPGAEFYPVWGADTPLGLPQNGVRPTTAAWFPPPGGFRFTLLTIPPDSAVMPPADLQSALAEAADKLPGMLQAIDVEFPHMHTTDTIDFVTILSGRLWLEVDDGREIELRKGDCLIQNGTRHAWHNRASEPCEMIAATVGARRA